MSLLFYRFIYNPAYSLSPAPFGVDYSRPIGSIHRGKWHHHGGDVCGIDVVGLKSFFILFLL